jgi:hypothetical protein
MLSIATSLIALTALAACNGPTGLMSGGKLEGESQAAPQNWVFAGDYGIGQLETHPAEPYSVNLAYTVVGGVLYVNAGGTETQWVQNMKAHPGVRLKIEDTIYALHAERVTSKDEISAFSRAWLAQSTFRRDPEGYDEVWIYRLVAPGA